MSANCTQSMANICINSATGWRGGFYAKMICMRVTLTGARDAVGTTRIHMERLDFQSHSLT